MRTTIEISDKLMNELMSLSKSRKKKEAVRIALEEFVRRRKIAKLLVLPGNIEVSDVTTELEELELAEPTSAD